MMQSSQQLRIFAFICCGILVVLLIYLNTSIVEKYEAPVRGELTQERTIFFVETTCAVTDFPPVTSFTSESGLHLSPRAACSIEAAARAHPSRLVTLVHTCPYRPEADRNGSTPAHAAALFALPNVRLWSDSLPSILKGSPLRKIIDKGLLSRSLWPERHGADLLRSFLLWSYGGTYVDTDVVLLRNLGDLRNFVCAENETVLTPSVLDFARDEPGRTVADTCVHEFEGFNPQLYSFNGAGVITRVLKRRCHTDSFNATPYQCEGFRILENTTFFPVHWSDWQQLFNEDGADETMEALENSLGVHLWSKLSAGTNVSLESQQPYAQIARRACPGVVAAVAGVL